MLKIFRLIKQVFIIVSLYYFSGSLATECVSLNNEKCMIRSTFIGLNPVELNYYPFIVNPDKCYGSCNDPDLSTKICVPSKTKDINIKLFNMITKINEDKTLIKHISCDWKSKLPSTTCNEIKNGMMKHINVSVKIIVRAKKIIVGILVHVFVRTVSISKCYFNIYTSVIVCHEIKNARNSVSTKIANTLPTNVTNTVSANVASTMSIDSDDKKNKI